MPDNDFWIGQEQIPVDLSLLLTYSNDEDYWYAPGEYALRVYTVDTLNTNFARPCFAFGERTSNPEMEDVSSAIENTLHELLDSGATPEDVYRIMGLVKESELSPETKEADSYPKQPKHTIVLKSGTVYAPRGTTRSAQTERMKKHAQEDTGARAGSQGRQLRQNQHARRLPHAPRHSDK